jgi:hypothetical protein
MSDFDFERESRTIRELYQTVKRVVASGGDPRDTWNRLLDLGAEISAAAPLNRLRGVDIHSDIESTRQQVASIVATAPIPPGIDAFYFGLFDAASVETPKTMFTGFYLSGVSGYDPGDLDSLVEPIYFPDERFLGSSVLDAVRDTTWEDNTRLFEILTLGTAGLLAMRSARCLPPATIVVGFDEGDLVLDFPRSSGA